MVLRGPSVQGTSIWLTWTGRFEVLTCRGLNY